MHHSALTTPPDTFDPAEDDSIGGWLERAERKLWDEVRNHNGTTDTVIDGMVAVGALEDLRERFRDALRGRPERWASLPYIVASAYVMARAPAMARKLYEQARKETIEP